MNNDHTPARRLIGSMIIACILLLSYSFALNPVFAISLEFRKTESVPIQKLEDKKPGQLPQSRIATGKNNILYAWYSGATQRYFHGVLGDSLEATQLNVETFSEQMTQLDLPLNRVFEDLEPRLADLNGDDKDEIIVVETDQQYGASIAVYSIEAGRLLKVASTSFLGQSNRWLNPLGVGDFDGDGYLDIALVATPHIGGVLRLYKYKKPNLKLFAEYNGISTHRIGSTELGLGQVVPAVPRDLLLVPDQSHQILILLEWTPRGLKEVSRVNLPSSLVSSLRQHKAHHWTFRLENGFYYEIQAKH
jgi:VCBS repeat protein